jgi:hypothetical protein
MSPRIRGNVRASALLGQREVAGRIRNLNLGGFFIAVPEALPVGELIRMRVWVPDGRPEPMDCFGWVRFWDAEGGSGAGVQLYAVSREVRERWSAYYGECRRKLARPQEEFALSA